MRTRSTARLLVAHAPLDRSPRTPARSTRTTRGSTTPPASSSTSPKGKRIGARAQGPGGGDLRTMGLLAVSLPRAVPVARDDRALVPGATARRSRGTPHSLIAHEHPRLARSTPSRSKWARPCLGLRCSPDPATKKITRATARPLRVTLAQPRWRRRIVRMRHCPAWQDCPSGTVTFLFTDLEGSTRQWEQHPEAMRPALERHDPRCCGRGRRRRGSS